jgi:hypothetical protein
MIQHWAIISLGITTLLSGLYGGIGFLLPWVATHHWQE